MGNSLNKRRLGNSLGNSLLIHGRRLFGNSLVVSAVAFIVHWF